MGMVLLYELRDASLALHFLAVSLEDQRRCPCPFCHQRRDLMALDTLVTFAAGADEKQRVAFL